MLKFFQTVALLALASLIAGCGAATQEDVDELIKAVKQLQSDVKELKASTAEDPNEVTAENVDAKFEAISDATNSDIANLQISLGELQTKFQTLGDNLAQAMNQLAAKNTEINTLNEQLSSLEADKESAEQALQNQVRSSETRIFRMERAADGLFDSVVVRQYREKYPDTTLSNQQLTLQIGDWSTQNGQFDQLLQVDSTFEDKYQQARALADLK